MDIKLKKLRMYSLVFALQLKLTRIDILIGTGGGQAKICGRNGENFFGALFGTHPQFFSENDPIFPKYLQDPPNFFRKCKFFPLNFGDLPTFPLEILI